MVFFKMQEVFAPHLTFLSFQLASLSKDLCHIFVNKKFL